MALTDRQRELFEQRALRSSLAQKVAPTVAARQTMTSPITAQATATVSAPKVSTPEPYDRQEQSAMMAEAAHDYNKAAQNYNRAANTVAKDQIAGMKRTTQVLNQQLDSLRSARQNTRKDDIGARQGIDAGIHDTQRRLLDVQTAMANAPAPTTKESLAEQRRLENLDLAAARRQLDALKQGGGKTTQKLDTNAILTAWNERQQKPTFDANAILTELPGYGKTADTELGRYGKGNIDLYSRPVYRNEDGSVSTVESASFNIDGKEVLLPTIAYDQNGKPTRLTDDEAIDRYLKTGEYLGKFNTPEEADEYAQKLHYAQDYRYAGSKDLSGFTYTPTEQENTRQAIRNLENDIRKAEYLQKSKEFAESYKAADFKQKAEEGAKKAGNVVALSQKKENDPLAGHTWASMGNVPDNTRYTLLTDDERELYNYLYATDEKKAKEYLDHIADALNYRYGVKMGSDVRSIDNGFGRFAATVGYGAAAGLDQFASGAAQLFSEEQRPTSALQYGSGFVRQDLGNYGPKILNGASLAQAGYDAVTTTANMAPSILLSSLTGGLTGSAALAQAVGAGAIGATAAGNAYSQALSEGYAKDEAKHYAAIIGALEAALQSTVGGISALGGLTPLIERKVANIENAALRIALSSFGSMLSEGAEEYSQDILEPFVRNYVFGENNATPLFTVDALYSGLLGALTAGVMEVPGVVSRDVRANRFGAAIQKDGTTSKLIESSLKLDPDSEAYQTAEKIKNGKLKETTHNVGTLFTQYAEEGGDLRIFDHYDERVAEARNKEIATDYFKETGVSWPASQEKAAVVQKALAGEELTEQDVRKLDLTSSAARAVFEKETGVKLVDETNVRERGAFNQQAGTTEGREALAKRISAEITEKAREAQTAAVAAVEEAQQAKAQRQAAEAQQSEEQTDTRVRSFDEFKQAWMAQNEDSDIIPPDSILRGLYDQYVAEQAPAEPEQTEPTLTVGIGNGQTVDMPYPEFRAFMQEAFQRLNKPAPSEQTIRSMFDGEMAKQGAQAKKIQAKPAARTARKGVDNAARAGYSEGKSNEEVRKNGAEAQDREAGIERLDERDQVDAASGAESGHGVREVGGRSKADSRRLGSQQESRRGRAGEAEPAVRDEVLRGHDAGGTSRASEKDNRGARTGEGAAQERSVRSEGDAGRRSDRRVSERTQSDASQRESQKRVSDDRLAGSWDDAYVLADNGAIPFYFADMPQEANGVMSLGLVGADGTWQEISSYPTTPEGLARFNRDAARFRQIIQESGEVDEAEQRFHEQKLTQQNEARAQAKEIRARKLPTVPYSTTIDGQDVTLNTVDPADVGEGMDVVVKNAARVGYTYHTVLGEFYPGADSDGITQGNDQIGRVDEELVSAKMVGLHENLHGYTNTDPYLHFRAIDAIRHTGLWDAFQKMCKAAEARWDYIQSDPFTYQWHIEDEVLAEAMAHNISLGIEMEQLFGIVSDVVSAWETEWDAQDHSAGIKRRTLSSAELAEEYAKRGIETPQFGEGEFSIDDDSTAYSGGQYHKPPKEAASEKETAKKTNPSARGEVDAANASTTETVSSPLGQDVTQKGETIVADADRLVNRKSAEQLIKKYGADAYIDAFDAAVNEGKIKVNAEGDAYAVKPEDHIDNRNSKSVRPTSVKAFQYLNPEIHPYYSAVADILLEELGDVEKGGQWQDYQRLVSEEGQIYEKGKYRTRRLASDAIVELKEKYGLEYADIQRACEAIIEDKGAENFAAAKRVELLIDDLIENDYESKRGKVSQFVDVDAYRAAKAAIEGAQESAPEGSWERYLEDNRLAMDSGEVTEQQLRAEWEAEHPESVKAEAVTQTAEPTVEAEPEAPRTVDDFVRMLNDAYGEGAAKELYQTVQQLERAKARAERRAAAARESAQAERSLAEQKAKDNLTAWMIYNKKMLRTVQQEYRAKLNDARRAKTEAVRNAVAETKTIERATADARVQEEREKGRQRLADQKAKDAQKLENTILAERMNGERKAAKRLGVKEDTYTNEKQERKEKDRLRRPMAKNALKDKKAVATRRAAIETTQGPVDTIRKNPAARTAMERLQDAGNALRTLGRSAYRTFVNQVADIDVFSKRQKGGMLASTLVNIARSSSSTTEAIYKTGLVDRAGNLIGESMKDVFLCWDERGKKVDENKQALLQDYMLHQHNVDRMSFVSKARAALETFETANPWLAQMDAKEFAKLVAMTDAETARVGKQEAREKARTYDRLLRSFSEARDKPVFPDMNGNPITADTSREVVAQYEKDNPWLVEKANDIYAWWDKFMRTWVVGDSLSEADYELMHEMYPHYVPTYRADKKALGKGNFVGMNGASVSSVVKKAKGGLSEIVNIEDSFANLANKAVSAARTNELYGNIIDTAMLDEEGLFSDMAVFDWYEDATGNAAKDDIRDSMLDDGYEALARAEELGLVKTRDGGYRLTAWLDGEKRSAYISEDMFKSISNAAGTSAGEVEKWLIKVGNALTSPMKTAITGINPNFALRNISRDLPTAVVNSISGLAFPKYWAQAAAEIAKNSDRWQQYQALGGTNSLYYNNESGFAKNMMQGPSLGAKAIETIGWFNEVTEAQTRFAEYLATLDRLGDTYENRLLGIKNAAEVTVDFGRKGRLGKVINAWVPYWNPAVQGIDKVIRSVIDAPQGSTVWKQASKTLGRAAMTTVLFEALLYAALKHKDRYDDWEQLSDRVKDTYYCIPIGETHTFLKIPKNREWGAILGTPLMRILEYANGRENPFENWVETSFEPNFLPGAILRPGAERVESDIIGVSQALDLAYNKDFAGRTIIPYAYQQGSKTEQYDAETSYFSRQLGELINFSPMQLDYTIKDYFGDFGKIFTMAASEATWSGDTTPEDTAQSVLDLLVNPWKADSRYSNQTVSDYYELTTDLDKRVQDQKNHLGDDYKDTVEYKTKAGLDKLYGKQISELTRQLRDMPDGEEKDEAKEQIAQLAGEAMDFYRQSMSGEVKDPQLVAQYATLPGNVSDELIRLNGLAKDYAFTPTDRKPSSYNDPKKKGYEYVLDDDQKAQYQQLYREVYVEIMADTMNKSKYRAASDIKKAEMLEDARDTVTEETKERFLKWLDENYRSTKKTK